MRTSVENLSEDILNVFKAASTPSIATLLYKRGLRTNFVQGVGRLGGDRPNMVGQAFTLRYIPAREDLNQLEVFRDPGHPQRVAVETVPPGHVLVMDCRGDATAASAGGILAKRLEYRGCAGIVTDGGLRDTREISGLSMPAYCAAASAPTNLTKHHAIDLNVPIGCGTAPVFPGDLMVGDADGVIVIPLHLAEEIAAEIQGMEAFEAFVLDEVANGASIIGLYPPNAETRARFEAQSKV
ncbi:ribonuclease activity regulator RraA [Roseibium sp. CAU 1637]|uniref:Ribonuclease activity regulator RraA n=1 Tax=Roseibium limicola TaxID=2816037 RepID=A0A939J5E6_9HYPH|nr:ribonuclease activity regulator RraA [Roseibium limicola]MBO0343987.1 ribonuclease activity regulator RraA [Roseibium limicola]